jgi:two-component system sensor histidine kinase VicK
MGDAAILYHRVILNLVGNAFRYTSRGGTIELGYRLEEKVLVIYVKDSGLGIQADKLEMIFDRGTQGDEANKGKAGLGLYNARQTVEAHLGRIWVESQPGKGTSFYFTLPLAPSEESEIPAA